MKFVIKLFPEITIKSRPVRKQFITQLKRNIKQTLAYNQIDCNVQGTWDAIEVNANDDQSEYQMRDILKRITGIHSILTVKEFNFETFDDILIIAKEVYAEKIKGKTFCVRVKRKGDHDFKSTDVEQYVGGGLLQHCEAKGVDLYTPEVTVKMEIKKQRLLTISATDKGMGGYPTGTQGAVLSLVSGGFDSNVASYLLNRRGLLTNFVFFNLGGLAHEVGVKQVAHYLWETYGVSHGVKFVTIPFEDVVTEILTSVDNSQMGVILKRMMFRAATIVAKDLGIEALVTGESIAQVSSQTLRNLSVIDSVTDMLVLRPLLSMDKPEIIDLSRKIGTYDFAAKMPEYCGVISVKPTTKAKPAKIEHEESKFNFDVLDAAVAAATIQRIKHVLASTEGITEIDLVSVPEANDLIIDIRHPQEEESDPLHLTNNDIVKIPFYELNNQHDKIPKDRGVLLYCKKGTMSQLHAEQLMKDGFSLIKVFKP
jgi:thiamine biosynthesis protein ThiI